ncbi:ABC transporter permease [Fictibacillus aquaticus]|uniref:Multidrug ABC transporter permease n=1 Tax=Fictibacillus aquaticus TaxID=2021314 RepID=A0A235FFE0_9BACL|nr:ABC transporter permease [Fictibacillus aquaticus]OYD59485.1 multidrug ABC transporter permease [Fictibacillus aquaticus]
MKIAEIILAEISKSHRHNFHNRMVYFSLLIWPALLFVTAYYSFKPFNLESSSPVFDHIQTDSLILFLLTGYLGYIFFWSLVQSAWQMAHERQSGTLEIVFLSPVSRYTLMFGRAAGNLIEAVWMFTAFAVIAMASVAGIESIAWWNVPIAFFILAFSAIIWGGFLNIVFLFSRDAGILFTVLEEPMQFFSGVRIPVLALPLWGKTIAYMFPLTYVLDIMRELLLEGASVVQLGTSLGLLGVVLLVLCSASFFILRRAEQHARTTGNMVLF